MVQSTGAAYAPPQIYTHGDMDTHTEDKDTATAVTTQMSTDKRLPSAAPAFGSHT